MEGKELLRKACELSTVFASEENINLFYQICKKPLLTTELKTNLTSMPLNRRLNMLREAGLIKRIKSGSGSELLNEVSPDAKKLSTLFIQLMEV